MGLYDAYEPSGDFTCAACGGPITDWQGKDGPNALLVWRQGVAAPLGHERGVAPESRIDPMHLAELRLPPTFHFSGWCDQDHMTDAVGRCRGDVWSETEIVLSGMSG